VGQWSLNWTTGGMGSNPFNLQLLGAGITRVSPYSPWILVVSLPIGALCVVAKYHRGRWRVPLGQAPHEPIAETPVFRGGGAVSRSPPPRQARACHLHPSAAAAGAGMTTLMIDGREHTLRDLWVPEMSLSSARAGRQAATYVLAVDRDTVLSSLSAAYDQYVREMKEDDELTGDPDALGRADYPPLGVVLDEPELLSDVVGGYGLSAELFAAVLPAASGPMLGTWAIDTVDAVHLDGECVGLQGTCYAF
jgi:hypothetical protein